MSLVIADAPAAPWLGLWFPLPLVRRQADEFLVRVLGPLMNGLVHGSEISDWHFERCPGRSAVLVGVCGARSARVKARMVGLLSAVEHLSLSRERGQRTFADVAVQDEPSVRPSAAHARVSCRSTQLALAVIQRTPSRPARLRAALALTVEATSSILPSLDLSGGTGSRCTSDRLRRSAASFWAGADLSSPHGATVHHTLVAESADGRRAEPSHRARLLDVMGDPEASHRCPSGAALRQLHNQLGLTAGDERLIYASLSRLVPAEGQWPPHRDESPTAALTCRRRLYPVERNLFRCI